MSEKILDGKKISNEIKQELKDRICKLKETNIIPGLAIILVGKRKDSETYVRLKKTTCINLGINNIDTYYDEQEVSDEILINRIEYLNNNRDVHGILVQLPLPHHINNEKVLSHISVVKDVDGFHANNIGNLALNNRLNDILCPCTPTGCIELLDRYNIELEGKNVVIIGKSNIVGMPLALLMMHRNATVSVVHILTKDIKSYTQKADILVSACGCAHLVKEDWIKNDTIILDVGINSVKDDTKKSGFKLVGDVDFDDVFDKVKMITPVPGGIGPMTIAILMRNTVSIAEKYYIKN